jgi:hypothetical protein
LNTTVAMAITITFPCWIWKVTLSERVRWQQIESFLTIQLQMV